MHVLVKFICIVLLALALSHVQSYQFISIVGLLTCVAFIFYARDFTRMLSRVKWLLLMVVTLYVFSTPGEYILHSALIPSPTYEGLIAGLTQMLNIVVMLASLTLLLSSTPRAKLIGGLYQALHPLKWAGVSVERFAVRTWLTLHYVESKQPIMQVKLFNLRDALDSHLKAQQSTSNHIVIDIDVFKLQDGVLVTIALIATIAWIVS